MICCQAWELGSQLTAQSKNIMTVVSVSEPLLHYYSRQCMTRVKECNIGMGLWETLSYLDTSLGKILTIAVSLVLL